MRPLRVPARLVKSLGRMNRRAAIYTRGCTALVVSGTERVLTAASRYSMDGGSTTPPRPVEWSEDGSSLYLSVAVGTALDLSRIDAESGRLDSVTELDGNLRGFSIAGGRLAIANVPVLK